MLIATNIEVKYSDVILVLRGISLEVPDKSIVCLLGANGAGKTTALRAISGMLKTQDGKITDGTIELDGKRIENKGPEVIAAMGVTQVMEGRRVLEHLTIEENLRIGAYISGDSGSDLKRDLDMVYDYFPPLRLIRYKTSGYTSGGEQQMLVIGRALMVHPKLMLLDEPSLGLAPLLVKEIYHILNKINAEEKTSILLVEQNAMMALTIAEYGYVMESGRIVLNGPAEKLKDNEDIREFYLGFAKVDARKTYREVKHYRRRKRWLG